MKKWNFYTSNEIKPQGWLKNQLIIQAQGLNGNLDKVWRDVRNSAWIGGDAEGWERVPYWLDGFIPLAYLLEDEDMISRAKKYIDAIISFQKPDGWICPCKDEERKTYDTWAVLLISKVLTVYYECSDDQRIPKVIYKLLKNYHDLLEAKEIRLFNWGQYRWFEGFIAIEFLQKRYNEPWITNLAKMLKEQGIHYPDLTDKWVRPLNKWDYFTHVVNLAMMPKYEAVSNDILGLEYTDSATELLDFLDKYNGMPVGTFTGDECLSGISPIQGVELCAVTELMYTCEQLYAYTGDKKWAERLELIAFNALPAANSDDMWSHQYDQMSNQIACIRFPAKSIFTTNGSNAHIFGLEPEYGCCTANFGQGWPKLTLSAFMHKGNRIINALPIPCELHSEGKHIKLETDYPFKNSFVYTVEAENDFDFEIRLPSFAKDISVYGKAFTGDSVCFNFKAGESRVIRLSFNAEPHFEQSRSGLNYAKCGSIVFALPVEYESRMLEYEENGIERKFPYCDYEYIPKSRWNYGYCNGKLEIENREVSNIPFFSKNPPVVLKAKVKQINWGLEEKYENVCARHPQSLEPIGDTEEINLYPYGCAKLRMTELPFVE